MSAADKLIAKAKERALARSQPDNHNHQAPAGYHLRGVSTLLDADGKVRQTWVKTAADAVDPAAFLDAFELALADREIQPCKPVKPAKDLNPELLTIYPLGDPHLGMLSWHLETGNDFDVKIAEANLVAAVDHLVELSPPSETALIAQLGDYTHMDSPANRTEASGHALDADSRWAKILRIGINTMIRCIDRALQKHKTVRVCNALGNHDRQSAVMLSLCLSHHYRNEPRAQIDVSPAAFHWYEHGRCLFGIHHGDRTKPADLPGVMACDQAEAWGRTKYRHWYLGHVHHTVVREYSGVTVESFRTLAPGDAWHHAAGYRAGRSMVCDVWNKQYGRTLRHEIGVEQLPRVEGRQS